MYCLDTNICIFLLKGRYPKVWERVLSEGPDEIAIPSMVKAELLFGAVKGGIAAHLDRAQDFLRPFRVLTFDGEALYHYADIRADLEKRGEPISGEDYVIAATARAAGAVLVTSNVREFRRVAGLAVEDWTRES